MNSTVINTPRTFIYEYVVSYAHGFECTKRIAVYANTKSHADKVYKAFKEKEKRKYMGWKEIQTTSEKTPNSGTTARFFGMTEEALIQDQLKFIEEVYK